MMDALFQTRGKGFIFVFFSDHVFVQAFQGAGHDKPATLHVVECVKVQRIPQVEK